MQDFGPKNIAGQGVIQAAADDIGSLSNGSSALRDFVNDTREKVTKGATYLTKMAALTIASFGGSIALEDATTGLKEANADLVVFRDTTDTPSTQWGGAALNVSPTFQSTGIALLDSYHLERQVTQLDFVFGRSDNGVANAGSLLNHKFMIAQLNPDPNMLATYDVVAHWDAIQNNQQYSHVINSAIFNPASDIDTPDDTSGQWHLFYETFNVEDVGFIIPKNSPGAFQVFGLGQGGTSTELLWQFSTGNDYIDWIDMNLDQRLAVPNPDFPAPFPQYAFGARGVAGIPEPSSFVLVAAATAVLSLSRRRRDS